MKAVVVDRFGAPDTVQVRERPARAPGPGELRVDAHAIGVNFPDVLTVAGKYQNLPALPFVPGKELAGTVSAVGAGVAGFSVGDRVMVQLENGAFAETSVARAEHCFRMPQTLPMVKAAALGLTYQTAWFALFDRARAVAGETVLVTGAGGGVGSATVQIAHAAGCRVLAGIGSGAESDAKRAFVLAQGADAVIDMGGEDLRDSVRRQVIESNQGRGADVAIESVGGPVFEASLRALDWSGRLVVVGFAGGEIPAIKANYLLIKHIAVAGLHWSDYRDRYPARMQQAQAEIFALWREGRLDPAVTAVFPLERAADAMNLIASRRVLGKVVLETDLGRQAREAEAGAKDVGGNGDRTPA